MKTLFVLALLLAASFSVRADDVPPPPLDYLQVQYGYFYSPVFGNTPIWTESWDLYEEDGIFAGGIWGFVGLESRFPGALPDPGGPGNYYSALNTIDEFVPASYGCAALVNGPLVCDMQALGIPLTFADGFTPGDMPYNNIVQADYNTLLASDPPLATPEPPTWMLILVALAAGFLFLPLIGWLGKSLDQP